MATCAPTHARCRCPSQALLVSFAVWGAALWGAHSRAADDPRDAVAAARLLTAPPCPDPGVTSSWNGRRYAAAVIGVPGYTDDGRNETRDAMFAASWAAAWPALGVRRQPAFLNSKELRGMGNMVGHYFAIQHALSAYGSSFDYLIVFEDDAIPHENSTWPGSGGPNELDAQLDALERKNGSALFLGGHTIRGYQPRDVDAARAAALGGVVRADTGYGSYAYVLTWKAAAATADYLRGVLHRATGTLNTDTVLWAIYTRARRRRRGGGAFISTPLLADHRAGSSETWRGIKPIGRAFQGSREWWRFTQP